MEESKIRSTNEYRLVRQQLEIVNATPTAEAEPVIKTTATTITDRVESARGTLAMKEKVKHPCCRSIREKTLNDDSFLRSRRQSLRDCKPSWKQSNLDHLQCHRKIGCVIPSLGVFLPLQTLTFLYIRLQKVTWTRNSINCNARTSSSPAPGMISLAACRATRCF
jgi:hypothetical protein